ncbi:MAG: chemotaxis protein [Defluviitaleaceae bacterium]|nr:chemotaxis protein [Defluviitaleaceae bacterium]
MVGSKRVTELIESEQTLQLMEFMIAGGHFGINVAKVNEIMKYSQHPVTPMPNSNPFVEGIIRPRTDTMTVINLAAYMGLPPSSDEQRDILIITQINNLKTAFHVHGVEAINVVKMSDIEKPDSTIYGGEDGMATGVAKYNDKLITIIDFEKILFDISPHMGFSPNDIEQLGSRVRSDKPILVAEDSPLLERLILSSLEKAGYSNITCASNGQEAWNLIEGYKKTGQDISEHLCAVITDIEMPMMDGHRLLRLIKEDPSTNKVPVIVFSSLITEEMRTIGETLGSVANISKPEIANLVTILDEHIL